MKETLDRITLLILLSLGLITLAHAHCQIPCGIYGDDERFTAMLEDVTTLRKSTKLIEELSAKESTAENMNQLVRWVTNKEVHADKISDVVLKYFLQQRIKADTDHYEEKLVALHKIVVLCMKVKQGVDQSNVDALEKAIRDFHDLYHHDHNH